MSKAITSYPSVDPEEEKKPMIPTPVFDDIQRGGLDDYKRNIFCSDKNLYGNITQWHI